LFRGVSSLTGLHHENTGDAQAQAANAIGSVGDGVDLDPLYGRVDATASSAEYE
jgi:hypothetical protein